ncbi:MAG TPA: glutaminase A [Tissierellaceae bacterium]|nr:glutaminase A [Tissierellaceae bacterium]
MEKILKKIMNKNKYLIGKGKLADYIPALSKANKEDIGLTIIDENGSIYQVGDFHKKFTIQSISKIISLFLAIIDNGEEEIFNRIGCEGTEEPFNTLFKLDLPHTLKPPNPMVNSGAILTTSLILGDGEEKFQRLLEFLRNITGNPKLSYNEEVYLSEKATGNKNRALAYLMKSRNFLEGDVENVLDTYFKQCAIEVTTEDLGEIGFFLASRNKDSDFDIEGQTNINRTKRIITAIMATSGMYNFSGEYAINVGIPSKSGVGGGIVGTIPNKFGIGIYSPELDQYGNSIVGYGIMKDLSRELKLNLF